MRIPEGTTPLRSYVNTTPPRARRFMTQEELYEIFADFPRPSYPFPLVTSEHFNELRRMTDEWVEEYCDWDSEAEKQLHKNHRFSDLAARSLPYLTLAEQIPVCRYTVFTAIIDDYLDHADRDTNNAIREKILDCMLGRYIPHPADSNFLHQYHLMYTDAQAAGIPDRLYRKYAAAVNEVLIGFQDEKKWKLMDRPPPLPIYTLVRRHTSGAMAYCKYVALQKDYRELPDYVLEHQHILRMHEITGDIVGCHNDFASLHHELARKGDVINIVQVMANEHRVSYEEAWMLALKHHDDILAEFILLQENLPDFGEWQELAEQYVRDLGTNIQGTWRWHDPIDTLRYIPNAYVEPSYRSDSPGWESVRKDRPARTRSGPRGEALP